MDKAINSGEMRNALIALILLMILHLCTFNASVFAHELVWEQGEDKRPRADNVSATQKGNTFEIRVKHCSGIGKTQFGLKQGEWPRTIRLHFQNFKALEGLKLSTDTRKFECGIPLSSQKTVIDLAQGFTLKRKGNTIYITAPAGFVEPKDKEIRIEWVDFYRN